MSPAAQFIVAILGVLLGTGVGAAVAMRKLKPEIEKLQAERKSLEATTMRDITEAVENLVGPLNDEIKELRKGREEDRKRIRDLEKLAGQQGVELVDKECRITELQGKVQHLEEELEAWKSGKKKRAPTGPLGGE